MIDLLLVEDSADDAEMVLRSLKKVNLSEKLLWLKDGASALDYLLSRNEYKNRPTSEQPRVIFLDLKLPKLDGLELLEEIKKNVEINHIPVVMMTSSREERDIFKSYDLGANSYLVKPVDFKNFSSMIIEAANYWLTTNISPRFT